MTTNVPPAPSGIQEGWIPWSGGNCPVSDDAVFEIELRNGRTHKSSEYDDWKFTLDWSHDGFGADIIAYRLCAPSETGTTGEALPAQLKKLSEYITYCEELEAEVAALKRDLSDANVRQAEMLKEIDALKRDAERYRFLRDGEFPEPLLEILIASGPHKSEVDAAIDAAKEKA